MNEVAQFDDVIDRVKSKGEKKGKVLSELEQRMWSVIFRLTTQRNSVVRFLFRVTQNFRVEWKNP